MCLFKNTEGWNISIVLFRDEGFTSLFIGRWYGVYLFFGLALSTVALRLEKNSALINNLHEADCTSEIR